MDVSVNKLIDVDTTSRRLALVFWLNVTFTLVEFVGGFLTNSTAIMADAIHDLGDCLVIGFAWLLNFLAQKDADNAFTYGYRRFSLLGALISGLVLSVGSVLIMTEALPRLFNPVMPDASGMLGLAVVGILVNGVAAMTLRRGKTMNEQMLNWHLLEDVLGWIAVFVVAVTLLFVDIPILDPLLSIAFTLFILVNVGRNLWRTLRLFLQANPDKEMLNRVTERLAAVPGVAKVHHLHFWSLDGELHVLSAHLRMTPDYDPLTQVKTKLQIAENIADFGLAHTTFEFELDAEPARDLIEP